MKLTALILIIITGVALADISMPEIFGDNMVLQRDAETKIWGLAQPGENVSAIIAGQSYTTAADSSGKWYIALKPSAAGGPYELTVSGHNQVKFSNILFGDVWLCSGQSNMEWPVSRFKDTDADIAAADYPLIRFITIEKNNSNIPLEQVKGKWQTCTPSAVKDFSAASFFFGRELYKGVNVPIGLVNSSYGGSSYQWWTPREVFQKHKPLKKYDEIIEGASTAGQDGAERGEIFAKNFTRWAKENNVLAFDMTDAEEHLPDFDLDDSQWQPFELPQIKSPQANDKRNIVIWYRKTVELPADWAGGSFLLLLGICDEYDKTFFNGTLVGSASLEKQDDIILPRIYTVPANLVRPGKNVISIRVYDPDGNCCMTGKPEWMYMRNDNAETKQRRINIRGTWKYKIASSIDRVPLSQRPYDFRGVDSYRFPSNIFNAMIYPIRELTFKGVVWYQGENNAFEEFEEYRYGFQAMIDGWRQMFNDPDKPFIFVQLPGYENLYQWAYIREAQEMALDLPKTAMVVATDIGEQNNIHPGNKKEIGRRLALAAQALVYNMDINSKGPVLKKHERVNDCIILTYDAAVRLAPQDSDLEGFEISDESGNFVKANAKIIAADKIQVWSEAVDAPANVRYNWANFPAGRLTDANGLPARPFRTDKPQNPYLKKD